MARPSSSLILRRSQIAWVNAIGGWMAVDRWGKIHGWPDRPRSNIWREWSFTACTCWNPGSKVVLAANLLRSSPKRLFGLWRPLYQVWYSMQRFAEELSQTHVNCHSQSNNMGLQPASMRLAILLIPLLIIVGHYSTLGGAVPTPRKPITDSDKLLAANAAVPEATIQPAVDLAVHGCMSGSWQARFCAKWKIRQARESTPAGDIKFGGPTTSFYFLNDFKSHE